MRRVSRRKNMIDKLSKQNPYDMVFESTFEDMVSSLFSLNNRRTFNSLKSDYFVEDGNIVINVDVAGSSSDDVDINYDKDQNMLSIRVAKQYEKKESKPQFYMRERVISDQSRNFQLPRGVDPESISAEVKNGLLTVRAGFLESKKTESKVVIKVNSLD